MAIPSSKLLIKFYNKTELKLEKLKNGNSILLGPLGQILTILNIFSVIMKMFIFHFFKK